MGKEGHIKVDNKMRLLAANQVKDCRKELILFLASFVFEGPVMWKADSHEL
jgi:hypothetical protein